jgi:predicted AlkP superfamily pyrophosphatase or phosphodiesterase
LRLSHGSDVQTNGSLNSTHNISLRLAAPLLVVTLIACAATASLAAESQKKRNVIVISLDGFPAYALNDTRLPMPTLRKLAHEGVIASSMLPINPTVTWPNHTTLVTGVNAAQHEVLFNGLLVRPEGGAKPASTRGAPKTNSSMRQRFTISPVMLASRPHRWTG